LGYASGQTDIQTGSSQYFARILLVKYTSNFISIASDRKIRKKTKLNNNTIQHNETKIIDRLLYI